MKKNATIYLSLSIVFTGLVAVSTMLIRIPVAATGGYINIGDAMIFICALTFGPTIGGLAGGIGSAIADMIGYPVFAPFTLVIKGLEGFLAGFIKDGKNVKKDLFGWGVGASIMVIGYFIAESYIMKLGIAAALTEVPGNLFQAFFGGLIGIPTTIVLRKRLKNISVLKPLLEKLSS
ncbi:MAG: ECF transporter S component [Candidatus Bathyarchaeia archaeon]|nr:ECF transporter S component [Candidatus Bathyarchaeota archaeon]